MRSWGRTSQYSLGHQLRHGTWTAFNCILRHVISLRRCGILFAKEVHAANNHMCKPERYDSFRAGLYTDLLSLGQEFERFVVPVLRRGYTAEVVIAAYQIEIIRGKDRLADLQTLLVEVPARFQIVLLVVDNGGAVAEMRT